MTGSWWKAQAQNNESVFIPFLRIEQNTFVTSKFETISLSHTQSETISIHLAWVKFLFGLVSYGCECDTSPGKSFDHVDVTDTIWLWLT